MITKSFHHFYIDHSLNKSCKLHRTPQDGFLLRFPASNLPGFREVGQDKGSIKGMGIKQPEEQLKASEGNDFFITFYHRAEKHSQVESECVCCYEIPIENRLIFPVFVSRSLLFIVQHGSTMQRRMGTDNGNRKIFAEQPGDEEI